MKIKKGALLILFLSLLIIPNLIAVEIILTKDSYSPRETLLSEIKGNFISLTSNNILIYEGDKVHSEPLITGLTKQNNQYYFYAMLPNKEGNYSLKIENAEYISLGKIKSDALIQNFTIKRTNVSVLSINPGFIFTNQDFEITVKSLDVGQKVSFSLGNVTKNISLAEETEETIKFLISDLKASQTTLKINDYSIPVFTTKKINNSEGIKRLDSNPQKLTGVLVYGQNYFFTIVLQNSGNENLTNITISNNFNAVIKPSSISLLEPGESEQVNLSLSVKIKSNFSGEVIADYGDSDTIIPLTFEITENKTQVNLTSGTGITESLSCAYIGRICLDNQECNGTVTSSLEGSCCQGECTDKVVSSYNWVYGVLLLLVVGILLGYFYYKTKKNQKRKSPDELLKEKSHQFKTRMNPNREVSGDLDRT
ncbi:MAG: hypothetical protein WC979_04260 [Candidatus Pacearchaeota archaeon]|jgi:hypothetical protein